MPELEYTRETEEGMVTTPITWKEAFEVESPTCPNCHVQCSRSPVGMEVGTSYYDDTPRTDTGWSGEFYCKKCRETIGVIHYKRGDKPV